MQLAVEYIEKRLQSEMVEGQMHGCLRDVGRLAGGLLATGSLSASEIDSLRCTAVSLAINSTEATTKWDEAVQFGRGEPVSWSQVELKPDVAYDWDTVIGEPYRVIDPHWIESVEVREPEQWDPVAQISEYMTTLFSTEEHVGYVTESWEKDGKQLPSKGVYKRTAGELLEQLARYKELGAVFGDVNPEVGAWIRFNPLDGDGVRDSNVTDYRFALVESDDMPIDQQRGVYEQLELPIAALVHSGNKSLHAIVRIEADSLPEYKRRVDLLYEICGKNGLSIDRQNRNPSRLSRMPGVVRGDSKQYLVATNIGKASWHEWEEWIEAVNDNLPDPESLAAEWDSMPPLSPPLIAGVLRQGHKMLVSGPSKAGKSYLLIELCAAIAEGRGWLGWQCTQGRVLYVNLELDRASCLHRFRSVYEALGWSPSHISNIDIWNLRGQAVPMDRLAPKLIRRSLKKQYAAVIIDPIYKVITGDENSADKMANFCNQFDKVCHELRAAVIYCHHHSKGAQGAKRSMDRASGSGVFARDPDALLDLIELVVSDNLRKQQENQAICDMMARVLDAHVPRWREDAPDDFFFSESQMRQLAMRLLGYQFDTLVQPRMYDERQLVASRSAWRIEGTFREYPRSQPVNCWFDHPCHTLDTDGVLKDTEAHIDEPPWKRGLQSSTGNKSKRHDRAAKLQNAFNTLQQDGVATLNDLAGYLDKSVRTVREWAGEIDGWVVEKGSIRKEVKQEVGF